MTEKKEDGVEFRVMSVDEFLNDSAPLSPEEGLIMTGSGIVIFTHGEEYMLNFPECEVEGPKAMIEHVLECDECNGTITALKDKLKPLSEEMSRVRCGCQSPEST